MKTSKLSFHDKLSLVISNMKVSGIPTQSSRVFIRLKQYHNKKKTKPTEIIENSVQWDDEVNLKCTVPKIIRKINRKFFLNISIRFEKVSGRGYVPYGSADIDISVLKTTQEFHINLPLQQCMEKSDFSCDIFNESPLNELTAPNNSILQKSIAVTESATTRNETTPTTFSTTTNSADQSFSEYSQFTDDNNSTNHSISNHHYDKNVKVTVFDNIEVNITEPKMKELENQVDYIVAQIINNTY